MKNDNRPRVYRRGIPYKSGEIKVEDLKNEFKFKNVEFSGNYSAKEEKSYLKFSYEGLKDLCSVLNMPSYLISLNTSKDEQNSVVLGTNEKGHKNLIITKTGSLTRNWVCFLDKFLANIVNTGDGFCNNVTSDMSDDFSQIFKPVFQVLKLKEKEFEVEDLTSDTIEKIKEDLSDVMAEIPLKFDESVSNIAEIEDARTGFMKNLDEASLNRMLDKYAKFDVNLEEVRVKLEALLLEYKAEYDSVVRENINRDLVKTNYYLSAIERNKAENTDKYTSNLELFAFAVNAYVNKKLKDISAYNSFLVNQSDLDDMPISPEESIDIFNNLDVLFANLIPKLEEYVVQIEDDVEEKLIDLDTIAQIDKVLNDDKGKFKLTLFKKLAKEIGLKVDMGKTEKIENNVYEIYFNDSYVKYIKPAIYNNPTQKSHCINIYCGDTGDTKQGYWWDYELDYNDLVKFILDLEKKNQKEEVKKPLKVSDKFKLTEFKNNCISSGLRVDKSETPVVNNKYNIMFTKSYIIYMVVPVYIEYNANKENKIKIKTMREEIYHTWNGRLDYQALIDKLVEIENQGQRVLKEDSEEVLQMKKALEKEKSELMKEYQKTLKGYNEFKETEMKKLSEVLDGSEIKTTKDLRDKMVKYIQMDKNNLPRYDIHTIEMILKENLRKYDNLDLRIERVIIPEKALMGNSRAWTYKDNCLYIQSRVENRKQIEALVEFFVISKLQSRNYTKVQKQMFKESLIFMYCKTFGLDVRTYCNDELFERFVKSGSKNISDYLNKSFKLYNSLAIYFK